MIRVYYPAPKTPQVIQREQERKMQREQAKRAARKEAAAAAEDQLQTIKANSSKRICSDEKYGEVALPLGVLQKVMSCLADIAADGVRGPSMAARDLANAALVSWDFHNASKHGFAALNQQAAQLELLPCTEDDVKPASLRSSLNAMIQLPLLPEAGGWSWQQWAAFLQDTLRYKVPELKQAARQLRVPGASKSSKAELVLKILQAFGLQQPSSVAPQLLRAVVVERSCPCPWAGCGMVESARVVLQLLGKDEVDRKWPGLFGELFASSRSTAADRRRTLHMYTGACSNRQLLQLILRVIHMEPLQEQFSDWRHTCQEALSAPLPGA